MTISKDLNGLESDDRITIVSVGEIRSCLLSKIKYWSNFQHIVIRYDIINYLSKINIVALKTYTENLR